VIKTARVRAARTMAMAKMVVGNKEGKGGKANGNGNKGGRQATAAATKTAMAMATRVVGK
jgi:hypothetical protein